MPTEQILGFLIAERDKLNRAIEALQGPTKRRGRPPRSGAMNAAMSPAVTPERKRRGRTAAQRKAQSEKMKKYWALRKKQSKD
jgi:hypothetical protein